ncbi:MAG: epimerase [Crocinitomicaceae bacterium]|nr:epimerase [Crocinitomicaceae bacterium]|tara:strand:+ start:1322 stop:1987 length:666 start_codon:yes stop_codon:yes gene_type:complete
MKVIITGATGMIGKGVLLECLDHESVTEVLSISRRSLEIDHPKLKELIHADFSEFDSVKGQLVSYDAVFCCMGVSAAGMTEENYTRLTHDYTMALARTLIAINPEMTLTYVSGQGTDSSEKGRSMWARVKGRLENDLLRLGFKGAFMYRPGGIIPLKGIQPSSRLYRVLITYLKWLLYLMKALAPNSIVDTTQIGLSMINIVQTGYEKKIIDPKDIIATAK